MNSSTHKNIESVLKAVASRMLLSGCLRHLTKAVFTVAAAAFALAALRTLFSYPHLLLTSIVASCGLLWFVWHAVRDFRMLRDPAIAARQIDREASLNNRVATAVELSNTNSSAIGQLLLHDALDSIRAVKPENIVKLPAVTSPIVAALALLAALSLLVFSPLMTPSVAADQTIQTSHAESNLNRLIDILKSILADLKTEASANPSLELDALIHETEETLQAIQEGDLSTAEAYLQLSKLQQQMLSDSQNQNPQQLDPTWQKVADALSSAQTTDSIADLLQSKQFQQAASKMQELDSEALANQKLTAAEITSLTEKLADAANLTDDEDLANVLKDLSTAIKEGRSGDANQKMQDLAAESAKYQIALDQAEHMDDLSEQLEMGKQQLAISSNSSGDGQMGGQGLNEETGKSKGKGGADSQKAGAKTAGNIDGPKADLEGQRQLAELQGQFGDEGEVEVKTKSTDERPDVEINRKAQSVMTEYSRQLEADLKQQQVPAGHQGIVRKYFESIRPANDERR